MVEGCGEIEDVVPRGIECYLGLESEVGVQRGVGAGSLRFQSGADLFRDTHCSACTFNSIAANDTSELDSHLYGIMLTDSPPRPFAPQCPSLHLHHCRLLHNRTRLASVDAVVL